MMQNEDHQFSIKDSMLCENLLFFRSIENPGLRLSGKFDVLQSHLKQSHLKQSHLKVQISNPTLSERYQGHLHPFSLSHTGGVFILLIACLIFFSHLYNRDYNILKENIFGTFFSRKTQREFRQTTIKDVLFSYFAYLQSIIFVAISFYIILIEFYPIHSVIKNESHSFVTIIAFSLVAAIFVAVKQLLYSFLGFMFNRKDLMLVLKRDYFVLIQMIGIIFFLPTLLLIYYHYVHLLIIVMIIVFFLMHVMFFLRIVLFFIEEKINGLFLIAYLCCVEILPCVFLGMGLFYIYKIDILNLLWV